MSEKQQKPKQSADKKQSGPPPTRLRINDTPQNVAKSLFGIKSDKPGQVTFKRD